MAQKYVLFEWHFKDADSEWGDNDLIVLPFTHINAVLGLLEDDSDVTLLAKDLGARTIVSDTAPSNPTIGFTWYDTVNGQLMIYPSTSSGADWLPVGGGGGGVTISDTTPTTPGEGDMWFDTTNMIMYVYSETLVDWYNLNETVKDQSGGFLKFWSGTQADLDVVDATGRDPHTIYFVEEDDE